MREMEKKLHILGIKALKDLVLGRRYHLREIVCCDMERKDWVFQSLHQTSILTSWQGMQVQK